MMIGGEPRFFRDAAALLRWFARHRDRARVQALEAAGRMHDAGHVAFVARRKKKVGAYGYEQRGAELPMFSHP